MCDTLVAAPAATADGAVLFAKNSDREPGEAQAVELCKGREHRPGTILRATWIEIPQARRTFRTVLCRPFWMWGAEMGANDQGVVIGNQAVFTRFDVPKSGLTGMDLVRIALERAPTAADAMATIIDHLERFGQGGRCGYRHPNFRYHSSFIIADPGQAWVLETAGDFWAARRVRTVWSLSNGLTIGANFDRISDGAVEFAVERGWAESKAKFRFDKAFGDPLMNFLAGAVARRRCTMSDLSRHKPDLRVAHMIDALRNHGGRSPTKGIRMAAPCAHASWLPTRTAGQTVGSMVSRLGEDGQSHWLTGTSSPCLSVFKPVSLHGELGELGPRPAGRFDDKSLFWRHELFHRRALAAQMELPDQVRAELAELRRREGKIDTDHPVELWKEHRRRVGTWADAIGGSRRRISPTSLFWQYQSWLDQMPLTSRGGGR